MVQKRYTINRSKSVNVVYDEETHEQSILHLHDEIYNTLVLDEIAYHLTKKTDMFIDELFDLIQE